MSGPRSLLTLAIQQASSPRLRVWALLPLKFFLPSFHSASWTREHSFQCGPWPRTTGRGHQSRQHIPESASETSGLQMLFPCKFPSSQDYLGPSDLHLELSFTGWGKRDRIDGLFSFLPLADTADKWQPGCHPGLWNLKIICRDVLPLVLGLSAATVLQCEQSSVPNTTSYEHVFFPWNS